MRKKVNRNYGIPLLRNASMIGAGNTFKPLYDERGKIQWTLSVVKQGNETAPPSVLKQKAEAIIASKRDFVKSSFPAPRTASKSR